MFADLIVDLFIANIRLGPHPARLQRGNHLMHIIIRIRHDRGNHHLTRRQPEGQAARMAFDQDADETFKRPQRRPVQHHGAMFRPIRTDIIRVQPLRQHEIHLMGATLPIPANRIRQHKFQLGAIKRTLAGVQLRLDPRRTRGRQQRLFRLVPNLVRSGAGFGAVREFDLEFLESQIAIHRA